LSGTRWWPAETEGMILFIFEHDHVCHRITNRKNHEAAVRPVGIINDKITIFYVSVPEKFRFGHGD